MRVPHTAMTLSPTMILIGMSLQWSIRQIWDSMYFTSIGRNPSFAPMAFHQQQSDTYHGQNLQFVLTAGLEGTGHHLMAMLLHGAPIERKLKHVDPTKQLPSLTRALFHHEEEDGLWNAHCNINHTVDLTRVEENAVTAMKTIRQNYEEAVRLGKLDDSVIRIPINAFRHLSRRYGMQSYPNFWGECRLLNYPSLDLFYNACDKANVDCRHLYIYRDPTKILASTTVKRDFNVNMPAAIQLYKTMLNILSSEMEVFRSRTLGCVGFYEDVESWQDVVRQLWGWKNPDAFQRVLSREYKPPSNNPSHDQDSLSPSIEPYLETLMQAHEQALEVCRSGPNLIRPVL